MVTLVALLLSLPAVAAFKMYEARWSEKIVESHTVFAVLEDTAGELGFDVAVLVRERQRGPNVLWFNDQWKTFFDTPRHPCGGYLFASTGNHDPVALLHQAAAAAAAHGVDDPMADPTVDATTQPVRDQLRDAGRLFELGYRESYHIVDPNGFVSETHLFVLHVRPYQGAPREIPIWVSSPWSAFIPDDGLADCPPQLDTPPHVGDGLGDRSYSPFDLARLYNVDVFGLWRDVLPFGAPEMHGTDQPDGSDVSGCQAGTEWECPEGAGQDDDPLAQRGLALREENEGNSHPYNKEKADAGDAFVDPHAHETAFLSLSFLSTLTASVQALFEAAGGLPPTAPVWAVFDTQAVEADAWYTSCGGQPVVTEPCS